MSICKVGVGVAVAFSNGLCRILSLRDGHVVCLRAFSISEKHCPWRIISDDSFMYVVDTGGYLTIYDTEELSTNDKTIKLWKVSERDRSVNGYNLRNDDGTARNDRSKLNNLVIPR